MKNENIEIKIAKQTIDLLKQYAVAKTQTDKDNLLKQINDINLIAYLSITQENYDALDLATKIEKAIKLDKFRPKNKPITLLAVDKDLENITGEFNTFDIKLNKMFKHNEDPKKIRDRFKVGITNASILAKQFSKAWIRRINNHKDLADIARKAPKSKAVNAYNDLFFALTQDFCKEYDCHISTKIVTDWEKSDIKPKSDGEKTIGFLCQGLSFPKDTSIQEQDKVCQDFDKNPEKYPNVYRQFFVRINITKIRENHPEPTDFFYAVLSSFAHEMHHALDIHNPRAGALGPQISKIDQQIYTPASKDINAYHNSASEISSYKIEHELFNQLKKSRF